MTLLVISPDYASHLLPLATLATAWQRSGDRVVVATGPATAGLVEGFGFEHYELPLGRGSNPGVIRAEQQPVGEDEALRGFFAATYRGMVETLRFQAEARRNDLLWEPVDRAQAVLQVVEHVKPDHIIVDHLAFSARLALTAGGVPHVDVVLGHPSALPVGDEVYGYPTAWPAAFRPDAGALAELNRLCRTVRDEFTAEWNAALHTLAPTAAPSKDAFTEHGDLVLYNYPAALHDPARAELPVPHAFLGSAVRTETVPADVRSWLEADDQPFAYVSFGSFLSTRADVLSTVISALRRTDLRVALATGSAQGLPPVPDTWLVRSYLPQTALLGQAAMAVTHAGNNSVTEALTAGVPMLALPFSTDQFAGAAAIETHGVGVALDPNAATADDVAAAVRRTLDSAPAAQAIGEQLRRTPGSELAFTLATNHPSGNP
ncbi:glycosyl transferase family 1 [Paractinoplanes abujensis]|uniref:MGT family glycosyltransferase n=1 Tax=Paractinoplanes abujensis TaxID=882441 RepID=A0A7W7G0W7_9ACTN|nr:glycosyltransferase [Actinoplanes abujensis]MBB4693503.1 MGT family glycosyltransferase [Actinoplanes abujensis]GID21837.1 glycosyl transferase family 1 [Actinoplanes abujensis]